MKSLQDLRIVFFGTPDFAVASLLELLKAKANIVAVVTAPDKPSGRGLKLNQTPVKEVASSNDIPVLQPQKLKDPDFIAALQALKADIHIVVAFRMLPEAVWAMPHLGTINVHGSLLPQYRGAAPINWAIINGEKETGVTTFRLRHEIDTGNILLQDRLPILPEDNAGTIYDKLKILGARLLVRTLEGLVQDSIEPQPQSDSLTLKHAPKIFKDDTQISWNNSAGAIHNFIRGLSPYPTAFTYLNERSIKIFRSHVADFTTGTVAIGTVETDGKSFLRLAAVDGWVYLDEVQLEGKKRLPIVEFLRGFRL